MAKSKSNKSRNPKPKTKTKIPSTPTGSVRRFFFKLELLGQRQVDQLRTFSHRHHNRDADETPPKQLEHPPSSAAVDVTIAGVDKGDTSISPHVHNHVHPSSAPSNKFKIALQNQDPEHPDAIIITTLDLAAPPFCCHEDLLAMPRSQLIAVADALNARLPSALAIDTGDERQESWIRNEIEWVVGIRGDREEVGVDVPGAPKAVRTWSTSESWGGGDFDILKEVERSPPTSPLTRKSLQMSPLSPRLERLAEEDEESEGGELVPKVERAVKMKRVGSRVVKRRKVEGEVDADMEMSDDESRGTPTPAPRVSRLGSSAAAVANVSPTPRRVLRSHSHNLGNKPNIETVFGGPVGQSSSEMATPKKTRSLRPLHGYPLVPEDGGSKASSTSMNMNMSTSTNSSLSMTESPVCIGRKRRRSNGDEEDNEMALGMKGMNMDVDADVFP